MKEWAMVPAGGIPYTLAAKTLLVDWKPAM